MASRTRIAPPSRVRFATVLAAMLCAVGAASAAPPKVVTQPDGSVVMSEEFQAEMFCVSSVISQDQRSAYSLAALTHTVDTTAQRAMTGAEGLCAKKYNWTDQEKAFGARIGQNDAIWDGAAFQLQLMRANPNAVLAAWNAMTPKDRSRFFDAGWDKDTAFLQVVDGALKAKGIPDDKMLLGYGEVALAALTRVLAARDDWVKAASTP